MRRIFPLFFCFFSLALWGQKFDPQISQYTLTLGGSARSGFISSFDFPAKKVEKGWWSFSRDFGRPLNMRAYYQVGVPTDDGKEIILLSKVIENKGACRFFLAVDEQSIPATLKEKYQNQVKQTLIDYRRYYYVQEIEKVISKAERKAGQISRKMNKAQGNSKEKLIADLEKQTSLIEESKATLRMIEQVK